jgi:hypothetical protein
LAAVQLLLDVQQPLRAVADIAATTLCRAVRAAPAKGVGPLRAMASAIAAALLAVKFNGGRVCGRVDGVAAARAGIAQMGTPASCRARMSRWMVRTPTSNRSASR